MKTIEYIGLEVKILLIFMLYIPYSTIYSQNCTPVTTPIQSVITTQSNINASQTDFNAINDEVVANDQGVAMNSAAHHFVIDLGKVYGPGSQIQFNIWGNGQGTSRKVEYSEIPDGVYLSSGGTNSSEENVNIGGPSVYTYTIANPTQYLQIDMTERLGSKRTEWTEVTILSDCTGGTEHIGAIEVNYPSNVDLPDNVALGVNGRMVIYNGNEPINNVTFNADIVNNFALVVAGDQKQAEDENNNLLFEADGTTPIMEDIGGGIISRDLGIGASNLFMDLADYVFAEDYALPTLEDTKAYVQKHKHLPAVIGEEELSTQGYFRIDRMLLGQLKHLEELLLHTIDQEEKIQAQEEENERLEDKYLKLLEQVESLEDQNKIGDEKHKN